LISAYIKLEAEVMARECTIRRRKLKTKCLIGTLAAILLVLFTAIAAAATTSLSVSDAQGNPESTVKVPIKITGASNVGAIEIVLTYDSTVLSVTGVEKGALVKNSLFDYNKDTPGIVAIGAADTNGINGDGSVANISFNVVGKIGDTSPLTLETAQLNDVNTYIDILVSKTSGTFTVAQRGGLGWAAIGGILAAVVILILAVVVLSRRRKPKITT